jgi:Putative peptidoglycan binding domain
MKPHKILFLTLIVSAAFAISAQAGDRQRSNGNGRTTGSSSAHYSGAAIRSGPGFRYGGGRTFAPPPRMTMRSMPTNTFSQRHVISGGNAPIVQRQFTPRTLSNGNDLARFQNNRAIQTNRFGAMQGQRSNRSSQFGTGGGNRTVGNITPGHNHVFAQQSVGWHRDWDRHSDHSWNGHRCRFVNGSWFIFDIGFLPWFGWPYDYYAYDNYPYGYPYGYPGAYQSSYYYDQNGYDSSGYDQGDYNSSYYNQGGSGSSYSNQGGYGSSDRSNDSPVADAQERLARAGYYHGQIDGVLGSETRHALVRYQSDNGLELSGSLTRDTLRALGMQRVARY